MTTSIDLIDSRSCLHPRQIENFETPRISIVIAVNGRAHFLSRSLQTLFRQDLSPEMAGEVIVIDNARFPADQRDTRGACTSVFDVPHCNALRLRYLAVQHPHPNYRNCGYAKNVGLRKAAAPVVMFSDGDVLHATDTISRHVQFHDKHPGSILQVYCRDCPPTVDLTPSSLLVAAGDKRYPIRATSALPWVGGPCFSAPRSALLAVGGIDESFTKWGYEDYDLVRRLRLAGGTVRYCDEIVTLHQQHPPAGRLGLRMKIYAGIRQVLGVSIANPNQCWGYAMAEPETIRSPYCAAISAVEGAVHAD